MFLRQFPNGPLLFPEIHELFEPHQPINYKYNYPKMIKKINNLPQLALLTHPFGLVDRTLQLTWKDARLDVPS